MRKFQCRDERDGTFGVIYHNDAKGLIYASADTYKSQNEAGDVADCYEKNPPDTKNWILVGRS